MKCMLDYGGQATCKQLAIKYGETSNFYISNSYHLAQRVAEKTSCRCMPRDSKICVGGPFYMWAKMPAQRRWHLHLALAR